MTVGKVDGLFLNGDLINKENGLTLLENGLVMNLETREFRLQKTTDSMPLAQNSHSSLIVKVI
jgi:hypothetical protein